MEKDDLEDGGGGTDRTHHSTDNHLLYRSRTGESDSMAVDTKKKLPATLCVVGRFIIWGEILYSKVSL